MENQWNTLTIKIDKKPIEDKNEVNIITKILTDFEPCELKDGHSTLNIPNNPYLKFVVLSIDKKGNNSKGTIIDYKNFKILTKIMEYT